MKGCISSVDSIVITDIKDSTHRGKISVRDRHHGIQLEDPIYKHWSHCYKLYVIWKKCTNHEIRQILVIQKRKMLITTNTCYVPGTEFTT